MKSNQPEEYVGTELEIFASAHNWRKYWCDLIKPHLGHRVLEVGAGIGSVTKILADQSHSWTALEPDPQLSHQIHQWANENDARHVNVVTVTIAGLSKDSTFDSVIYIDVLEHIENDQQELQSAAELLAPGGNLIVLVPAHNALYSKFDESIGHFRRYNKRMMKSLRPSGMTEDICIYLDSVGLIASAGNRLLIRSSMPTTAQVSLWDTKMIPISKKIDGILGHKLGKSLVTIWTKDN